MCTSTLRLRANQRNKLVTIGIPSRVSGTCNAWYSGVIVPAISKKPRITNSCTSSSLAFFGYLGLVVLSVYTLVGLVAITDGSAVQGRLAGRVPERFAAGVLTAFGALFFLRVFLEIGGTLTGGEPMPGPELGANISDFFTSPLLVIGGVQLWRRRPFGYLAGLGLLFQASALFIALILFLVVQPVLTNAPFAALDVVFVLVMGLVCFVPFGLFLKGALERG